MGNWSYTISRVSAPECFSCSVSVTGEDVLDPDVLFSFRAERQLKALTSKGMTTNSKNTLVKLTNERYIAD